MSAQEGGQSAERGKFEKTEVASEVGRSDPKKIVLPPSLGGSGTGGLVSPLHRNFMEFGRMRIHRSHFLDTLFWDILGQLRICCSSVVSYGCLRLGVVKQYCRFTHSVSQCLGVHPVCM